MKCRYFEKNLIGYIEKTLSAEMMQDIALHSQHCAACRKLLEEVYSTYNIYDSIPVEYPDLQRGIDMKRKHHHTAVVEFIPQHRVIYRIAASVIIFIGIGLGVLLGGKYSTSRLSNRQSIASQYELPEYYITEPNSMDGESDLAVLYPNE